MLRRTFTGMALALGALPLRTSAQTAMPSRTLAEEITRELLLIPEYTLFDWIAADMLPEGGVVMRGQATRKAKTAVLARLQPMLGGILLRDEIALLPSGYDDERLRFRLFSALLGANPTLQRYARQAAPPIHILVKQGHVTLKGTVRLSSESLLAEMRARGVRGVRSVKNELRVIPPQKPNTLAANH